MPEKVNSRNKVIIPAFAVIICVVCLFTGCKNQPQMFTIGMVNDSSIFNPTLEGFKTCMTELGYIEGKNMRYIYNGIIENNNQSIDAEIEMLLARDIDLLVTAGSLASSRAKCAADGSDVPVVFMACLRPIEEGIIESLIHPGQNITGVATSDPTNKALEFLKSAVPGVKRIYIPYNPDDQISLTTLSGLDNVAMQIGLELLYVKVYSVEEAIAIIEDSTKNFDAVYSIPSPTLNPRNSELSQAAIKRKLPMVSIVPMDETVLIALASDFIDIGKQAARLAHQIYNGVKSSDLPVETSETFLTVNLDTAEKIGINIPYSILAQADKIIR